MDDRWCELQEQPFHSDKPLVGRLIVWFRTLWNNVATRWYIIPIMQQQTAINHRLRAEIGRLLVEIASLREELSREKEISHGLRVEMAGLREEMSDEQEFNHGLRVEIANLREELSSEQEIRHVLDTEMVTTRRDQVAALYSLQAEFARLRARLEEAEH